MKYNKFRNIQAARILRKDMTSAEKLLWKVLSNRGMCKVKFRRQYPVDGFILDFFCPAKKLGIELDGSVHKNKKEYDKARQEIIENRTITILRFTNNEVIKNIDLVLQKIKRSIFPSPLGGEGCPDEIGTG